MKKNALLLCLLLLLSALSGCGEAPPEPERAEPLHLETLRVELSRNGLSTDRLLAAARELPDLLKTYFAGSLSPDGGVEIDKVAVSVGASPAATAQALADGSVDLAFLPAEAFLRFGGGAAVLKADAPQPGLSEGSMLPEDWNGAAIAYEEAFPWPAGTFALICAAPTEYGGRLVSRVEGASWEELANAPTWDELDHARWGVLGSDSLGGYRCLDLWLADRYGGNDISDLADVTAYESYAELFRAAARGEIDAFPVRADARMDVAEAWTLLPSRTAAGGMSGFGREKPVWDEVRVFGVTETLYTVVAAAGAGREDLSGEESCFPIALDDVLFRLYEERPELMETLGSARFYPVADGDLDPLRRLMTMEGTAE